jgi:lipoprotein-anchoring transpeptidase ErfK/SrfK
MKNPVSKSWLLVLIFLAGALSLYLLDVQVVSAQTIHLSSSIITEATSTPQFSNSLASTPVPLTNQSPTPSQTPDKYYSSYFAHPWDIPEEVNAENDFWIEVDLSNQTLYAYHGDQIINAFLISSGTSSFPTVTGTFKIFAKYSQYTMRGPEYDISDVPYTMFFYKGYSIHGTYWHDNFGTPMSHGCVNMDTTDAAWIYENAPVGTYVFIHN